MDACTAAVFGTAGLSKGSLGGWGSDQCVKRFLGELNGRGRDTFTPSGLSCRMTKLLVGLQRPHLMLQSLQPWKHTRVTWVVCKTSIHQFSDL